MMSRACVLCLSVLVRMCVPTHLLAQTSDPKNTPQVTSGGVTFTTPAGWSVSSTSTAISVTAPEGDSHVAVLDEKASDAATAIAQAWATYKPDFKRPLRTSTNIPDHDGWTTGKRFIYETSPNEKAVIAAVTLRAGDNWTVVLLNASDATMGKRGAQVGLIVGSLRPRAYQRESFGGRKAMPLKRERIEALRSFVETSPCKVML